jgi:hypothetical protein
MTLLGFQAISQATQVMTTLHGGGRQQKKPIVLIVQARAGRQW